MEIRFAIVSVTAFLSAPLGIIAEMYSRNLNNKCVMNIVVRIEIDVVELLCD